VQLVSNFGCAWKYVIANNTNKFFGNASKCKNMGSNKQTITFMVKAEDLIHY